MTRRRLIEGATASLALLATGCNTVAPAPRVVRIGAFTGERTQDGGPPDVEREIMDGLRAEGFVQGETMTITWQHTQGDAAKYPAVANALVAAAPDLLIASSSRAAVAAKAATTTIPIVMQGVADPRDWGVVVDYAHPGGNITGTAFDSIDEARKRIEIFHEAFPNIDRVVVVGIYSTTITPRHVDVLHEAGRTLEISVEIPFTDDVDALARVLETARGGGIVVGGSVSLDVSSIIAFASANRVPAIYARPENVAAGGLMSYGNDRHELRFVVGRFVREIVDGTPPGDIPVWLSERVNVVFNATTAERGGFELPRSVSGRVTDVVR